MLFAVLNYVIAAVHALFPPYLVHKLWRTCFRTVGAWLIEAGFTAAAGNHVWLRRDSLYVVLAHLKQGSVRAEAGERVEVGAPLAQVGHTGNTTEPHLHLHAVRGPAAGAPSPDSLANGAPVPVTISGRFLTRNDVLPSR